MEIKNNKTIITLVSVSVLAILAIAFLSSLSEQTLINTQKSIGSDGYNLTGVGCYDDGQVQEGDGACNITLTNAPTGWKQDDCALTSLVVKNDSETKTYVLDTDYSVDLSQGIVYLKNTTDTEVGTMGDEVKISYEYCGDNYLPQSWARSVLNTNVGLFVIAILIAIVMVVYLLFGKQKDD